MQPTEGLDIAIVITQELAKLPMSQSHHCIYRVHNQLRMVNEKAYDPEIIAIGPYHRDKENLKMMEEHKLRYLKSVLERGNENVEIYVETMKSLEETARKCYVELPKLNAREFIQMLISDGCFIVELLHKFDDPSLKDENDPIFAMDWILNGLKRDLMLFENQIPFFVLFSLFNMIRVPNQDKTFNELALRFFVFFLPGPGYLEIADNSWHDQTKHLLRMIRDNWLPSFAATELCTDAIRNQRSLKLIHCATELIEAGVKFEKAEGGTCLLYLKFSDGTMQIPL